MQEPTPKPTPKPPSAPPSKAAAEPSPPTRVQTGRPAPLPPTRVQGAAPAASPPTRVQTGAPAPSPPTRVQRATSDGTAVSPPTRLEAGDAARRGDGFPSWLRDRYEPLEEAGRGSEGRVWRVRVLATGAQAAVKVAHAGLPVEQELLAHLRNPDFRRHVPEIFDFGSEPSGWLAMEYLPRTLATVLGRSGGRTPGTATAADTVNTPNAAGTYAIITELVDLLEFWQDRVQRNPLDLKPANILVRPGPGLGQFVIADFGGVTRFTASQRFADAQITIAYMAPEQLYRHNHTATPWWSLGNVLYELFTGRRRFTDATGEFRTDEALQRDLVMQDEPDLSDIGDDRRQMLLRGLFTKDPDDRWTAGEVRSWLAGGSPEVVRPVAHQPQGAAARRRASHPITFRGVAYVDPAALAEAMLARSEAAEEWLVGDGAERLRHWLQEDVQDADFDLGHLRRHGPSLTREGAAQAVLAFGAVFAPHAEPRYQGRRVDAGGIERIAAGTGGAAAVRALLAADVPNLAAGYRCDHPACGPRCRVLTAIGDEVPDVVAAVRLAAPAGAPLTTGEEETAYALAVRLTAHPEQSGDVLRRLPAPRLRLPRSRTPERGAWESLAARARAADPARAEGRAAVVAAAVLHGRVLRQDAEQADRTRRQIAADGAAWAQFLRARAAAAGLVFVVLALAVWAGAMLRMSIEFGNAVDFRPGSAFGGPLLDAGTVAARGQFVLLAAALVGALALAAFPAPSGRALLAVAGTAATVGYRGASLPPFTVLRPPGWVLDRLTQAEGTWGRWGGVAGLLVAPALAVALGLVARPLLVRPVPVRGPGAPAGRYRVPGPARWRNGRAGLGDRAAFTACVLAVLLSVLWAAVEFRLAVDAGVPRATGTAGAEGARYQSDFVLALAGLALLAGAVRAREARRLFGWSVAGTAVLGLWPPPVRPAEAFRVPVADGFFTSVAGWWGGGAFWAALLLAVPGAVYGGWYAVRRSRAV